MPARRRFVWAFFFGALEIASGCQKPAAVEAGFDYSRVDLFSADIYAQVVEGLHQTTYVAQVAKGFAASPSRYEDVVLQDIEDGDYTIAGVEYQNVLASIKHSPRATQNLTMFAKLYPSMKELFSAQKLDEEVAIKASDLRLYYRFGADFLALNGFAGDFDKITDKYSFNEMVRVIRTGIFVTQLDASHSGKATAMFGLLDSKPTKWGGTGLPALAAVSGTVSAEVTGRTSMGPRDNNQCQMAYSSDWKINGMPMAGVDGTTFGSNVDGTVSPMCGKCATIGNTKYVIADRIWQNDGTAGKTYTDKNAADQKQGGGAAGTTQFDISVPEWLNKANFNNGKTPDTHPTTGVAATIGGC